MTDDDWLRRIVTSGNTVDHLLDVSSSRQPVVVSKVNLGTEALEWVQSMFLFMLGAVIMSQPLVATGSILAVLFEELRTYGMAVFMLLVGGAGVLSVYLTASRLWYRVRALCSIARTLVWLSFVVSMSFLTLDVHHISPMMVSYSVYTVGEIAVTYTLAHHARSS